MDQPTLELLSGRAHPQLAEALRGVIERIMHRWQTLISDTLPSADKLTFRQIRNDLPKILEHAAKTLESAEPFAARTLEAVTLVHGQVRFNQNFRLEELLTEYCILR